MTININFISNHNHQLNGLISKYLDKKKKQSNNVTKKNKVD